MNNKKLFKGALVLFASILMAVSCSSNSKPEDDNKNNNNNNTTTKTDLDVTVTGGKDSDDKIFKVDTTTTLIEINSATAMGATKTVSLTIAGTDKDAVKNATIKSVEGLDDTETKKATAVLKSPITSKVALDSLNAQLKPEMITVGDISSYSITLTATDELAKKLQPSKLDAETKGGVIKVTVVLNPKDATNKNTKELTLFVGVKGHS